jgi:C4-dicarboxylate-binding protein DctP
MRIARRSLLAATSAAAVCTLGAGTWMVSRSAAPGGARLRVRFSHVVAEDTPKGKAALYFAELVRRATDGEVVVEVFPNSTLYRDKEELEALHLGSVEMIAPSLAKVGSLGCRDFEIFDLPFLFDSYTALHKVTDGELGESLMQRIRASGLLGLAFWDNGFKHMSANRPLVEPQDFRGLKMRIQASEVSDAQMRALGATPDPMAFSDVYAALASGVVDGTENPTSNFLTQQIYKVQRYLTLSAHGYLGYVVLVKERFWQQLPRDVREALRSCMLRATAYANDIAKGQNDGALEKIRALGTTAVIELPEPARQRWKNALAATHTAFRQRAGSQLLDAVYAATDAQPIG